MGVHCGADLFMANTLELLTDVYKERIADTVRPCIDGYLGLTLEDASAL